MSESELARRFNVDFDDICSEVWEFCKKAHHRDTSADRDSGSEEGKKNV